MRTTLSIIVAVLLAGCVSPNQVLVNTGTIIGVDISENPATQLYHARFGYVRSELAVVPSTNHYTPDVITELRYSGIFSTGENSGIYQRLAVGTTAVSQPGAAAMFLKDASGNISTNTAAVIKSLSTIPAVNASALSSLAKIATVYRTAQDKVPWDTVAKANGYTTFAAFLIDPTITPEKVAIVADALRNANLIH